jgi:hypothetical protein
MGDQGEWMCWLIMRTFCLLSKNKQFFCFMYGGREGEGDALLIGRVVVLRLVACPQSAI